MADLKTAASAVPGKLVELPLMSSSEGALFSSATGVATDITSTNLANTTGSPVTVFLSVVKSGGMAGAANRVLSGVSIPAYGALDVGKFFLNEGDFISGYASSASAVSIVLTGVAFSNSGAIVSGIQDDAVGSGGRVSNSSPVNGTNTIGTGSNRYLLAGLMVANYSGSASYSTYSTLTMSCTDGAMTLLGSCNFTASGSITGSVHLFGRATPSSGSTQTLTAAAVKPGFNFDLTMASISLSGVGTVSGIVTDGPGSAAALSLPVTSAVGDRAFFVGGFNLPPQDFSKRVRAFNGSSTIGFDVPHWLLFGDALGAATVTAATSNSDNHAAVGVNIAPA